MDDCVEKESTKTLKLPKSVCYSYNSTFNLILLRHVGETSGSGIEQNAQCWSQQEELLLKGANLTQSILLIQEQEFQCQ